MTAAESAMLADAIVDAVNEAVAANPYRPPRVVHTFSPGDRAILRPGAPRGLAGTGLTVLEITEAHPQYVERYGQRLRVKLDADGTDRACWAMGLQPEAVAKEAAA